MAAGSADHLFSRLSIRLSTTVGSASVEVSPSASISLAAILRRMRRMILPDRVFGSPGAHWIRLTWRLARSRCVPADQFRLQFIRASSPAISVT